MKELILELSSLTLGQINSFNMEEAIECAEKFNRLKETMTQVWTYFDRLRARCNFRGTTAELISKHANGVALELAAELMQLTTQYFPSLSLKEAVIIDLYQKQAAAEIYLEYKKYETRLEMYKSLLDEHVDDLVAQDDSTLAFY